MSCSPRLLFPDLRALTALAIVLAAFMLALLWRETMPLAEQTAKCVINFRVAAHINLLLNCDAAEFMRLGYDPSRLLEPGNLRQSRPLFVGIAHALSWLLRPLVALLQPLVPGETGPNWRNAENIAFGLKNMLPVYLGYVLLNVAILLATALLYLRAIPRALAAAPGAAFMLVAVGSLLFCNDVVKIFVWSPHTQMLNILVPVLACRILAAPPAGRRAVLAAAAGGLAMLVYANMVILLAALLLGRLQRLSSGAEPRHWRANAGLALLCIVLFALPTLVWSQALHALIGSYEQLETRKYREIVWILDAWQQGWPMFVETVALKIGFFAYHFTIYALPSLGLIAFAALRSQNINGWLRLLEPALWPTLGACVLSLGFFIVLGWPAPRLAFAAIPPLLVLAGYAMCCTASLRPAGWPVPDRIAVAAAAFGYALFILQKDGPWS
jgi:hypothetical protein